MSVNKNRIVRSPAPFTIFEEIGLGQGLSTASNFNQGDLLIFDATTKLIRIATSEAEGATMIGISRIGVVNGVAITPYQGLATTSRSAIGKDPGPICGVEAALVLKSGDALAFGAAVYLDPSDGAEFVQASGTKAIGYNVGPAITGDGIKTTIVRVGARYPNDTLSVG